MTLLWIGNIGKANDGRSPDLTWQCWPALEQPKCHAGEAEEASLTRLFLSISVFSPLFPPHLCSRVCRASPFELCLLHRRLFCFEPRIKRKLIPTDTSYLENTPTASIIFDCFPHNTAQSFLLKAIFEALFKCLTHPRSWLPYPVIADENNSWPPSQTMWFCCQRLHHLTLDTL